MIAGAVASVVGVVRSLLYWVSKALERANVIERSRLRETVDLAWPRILTGFARMSKQTADVAMVGLVFGPQAIAGLAFAYAYWQVGNRLSLGLSGGSISLVSQYYGADRSEIADRAITQSYLLATVLAFPLIGLFYIYAEELIELMGASPAAVDYGGTYLTVLAPALLFEFYNKVASRVFASVGDTFTPMVLRGSGAVINILLNLFLIFGLGLGVVGAALGTLVSTVLITGALLWGLVGKSYLDRDPLPVTLTFSGPTVDLALLRPLIAISTPLMFQELARAVVVFPLLAIAALFGPVVVAGYEIGRRVRDLINSLSWGFSIASSSLVGRHLGAGEEDTAAAYGTEIIRFSLLSYLLISAVVIVFAPWIARLFVTDSSVVGLSAQFVRVAAVASVGLGIDLTATGALRGAGDTRWPFYAALVGLYGFTLPVAYLGAITPLGVSALFLSLVVETFVPAAITSYRYNSGVWLSVSRSIRSDPEDSLS